MNTRDGLRLAVAWTTVLLAIAACQSAPSDDADQSGDALRPIHVEGVSVEVGIGSPIPVEVVVGGTWPDLCAQLARVEQVVDGSDIAINVLASPADVQCPPDYLGLPFRLAVPLNVVEMDPGQYSIVVNGVGTSFELPLQPQEQEGAQQPDDAQGQGSQGALQSAGGEDPDGQAAPLGALDGGDAYTMAYVGSDGNLWAGRLDGADHRQVTTDATSPSGGLAADRLVNYYFPEISSDGRYVAVRRDEGQTVVDGIETSSALMVYDLDSGDSVTVFDESPAGFAWQPGTHLLAYAQPIDEGYFSGRGEVDAAQARAIMGYDMATRLASELVSPDGGYAIYSPKWSPDGRYVSFEEVWGYEGSGYFAYSDLESKSYLSWSEAIGLYDWSPDGQQIAFDRMTYAAGGDERIYRRDLVGGEEELLSTDTGGQYAFSPSYSPLGDRIAYFVSTGTIDEQIFELYVQDLDSGEVTAHGDFIGAQPMTWTGDGKYVVFSFRPGPSDVMQILAVSVADGTIVPVATGASPTVATIAN